MGRLRELINIFINPIPEEKSFDELATDAGIGETDLKLLKSSMGGVTFKFADDVEEETKRGTNKKIVANKEVSYRPTQKNATIQEKSINKGEERD